MTENVVYPPSLPLATWREVIRRPDLYDHDTLLEACHGLMAFGDHADYDIARQLHAAVLQELSDDLSKRLREMDRRFFRLGLAAMVAGMVAGAFLQIFL